MDYLNNTKSLFETETQQKDQRLSWVNGGVLVQVDFESSLNFSDPLYGSSEVYI